MKNMKQFRNALWLAAPVAALSLFSSCTKEEEELTPITAEEVQFVNSQTSMDAYYEDADDIVFTGMVNAFSQEGGRVQDFRDLGCAELLHNADTRTLTINFGESCTGPQGHVRSGKIIVSYAGKLFEDGFTQTVSFENFSIDGVALEGTRTLSYEGGMDEQQPRFQVVLSGGKITWPDNTFATREVNQKRTIVLAANDGNIEYLVSGTASGTRRSGETYMVKIDQPLTFSRNCILEGNYVPVKGALQLTREGKESLTVDYGDGACDKEATILVNGRSQTITIGG
jgi:hypothetical protein